MSRAWGDTAMDLDRAKVKMKETATKQPGLLSSADMKNFISAEMEASGHAAYVRNLGFALRERLAFSPLLEAATATAAATTSVLTSPSISALDSALSTSAGSLLPPAVGRGPSSEGAAAATESNDGAAMSAAHAAARAPATSQFPAWAAVQGAGSLSFHTAESQDAWAAHPELARAREQLCGVVALRVRDLQLLTDWPLVRAPRTPAQVAALMEEAEEQEGDVHGEAWRALGATDSPFNQLPRLPELVRRDAYGPLDLLLALAGHLVKPEDAATPDTTAPAPASPSCPVLPNVAAPAAGSGEAGGQGGAPSGSGHTSSASATGAARSSASPFAYPSLLRNQAMAASLGMALGAGAGPSGVLGSGGAVGAGGAGGCGLGAGGLPRSLALVSTLPALKSLKPPTLEWLRGFFGDLRPQQRHVGVDDRLQPWFREVKVQAARALLQEGSIPLCRSFAKYGVPHGCRAAMWETALGLKPGPPSKAEEDEFERLVHGACRQQLLADLWVCEDLALVRNSEHFFLFEEILRSVMLALLRDPRVGTHCSVAPHPAISVSMELPASESQQVAGVTAVTAGAPSQPGASQASPATVTAPFPPCGVLLPQGSVLLAAPLCFLHDSPAAVYRLHRALYCRYWCKLHSLSPLGGSSPALPMLLRVYEELLTELDPEVVVHLHRLGVPMTALALPWMSRGFVGYLPVEEVLLLWDRVVGLDSLLPVALLAAAVVCFRRQVVLSCASPREILEAMGDLSQLRAVPLLQAVLFQG